MGMVKVITVLLMILLLIIIQSCIIIPTRNLRKFTLWNELKKESLTNLKIEGIYYTYRKNEFSPPANLYIDTFILYADGTYFYSFAYNTSSLDEMARQILIGDKRYGYKYHRNNDSHWGAFIIQDDKLLIQSFESFVNITAPLPPVILTSKVYEMEYKIVNDSTLIKKSFKGKLIPIAKRDTFRLYPTKLKPDSVNLFMTNKRTHNKLERLYKKRHRNDKLKN